MSAPVDLTSVLALRAQILQASSTLRPPAATATRDFGAAIADALQAANVLQDQAGTAATAFERGDSVDIAGVMLARQKASIAFEATLQVRNKLLSAYRDIMSMPV